MSGEGEVVYAFAPDFRGRLRHRSFVVSTIVPAGRRAAALAGWLGRVGFGVALVRHKPDIIHSGPLQAALVHARAVGHC